MPRAEAKKETRKGGFVAVFFLWMLCMNLILLKDDISSANPED